MSSKPVLYHNEMSVCSAKVRMAFAEKGVAWDGRHLNLRAGDAQLPEYVALNPNKVVPTLLDRGRPIIESNVICEYIDDFWPTPPLRPTCAYERARMRLWMKRLDDGIHLATFTVSFSIAFRYWFLERTPAERKAYLDGLHDPARRERMAELIEQGMESPAFHAALLRFAALIEEFDRALSEGPWLVGETFTLADVAYAPYLARLAHLGLDETINRRPRVAAWRDRLVARQSFEEGVTRWFNPSALALFERERPVAREAAHRAIAG